MSGQVRAESVVRFERIMHCEVASDRLDSAIIWEAFAIRNGKVFHNLISAGRLLSQRSESLVNIHSTFRQCLSISYLT